MAEIPFGGPGLGESVQSRLAREVGILAGRLAQLLERLPVRDEPSVDGRSFLWSLYDAVSLGRPPAGWTGSVMRLPARPPHPLDNLVAGLGLSPVELDIVLLAGLADEHEGLSALLRVLHPTGEPRPTTGLAAQLFCRDRNERERLRTLLVGGPAARSGVLLVTGDGPFFERGLMLAEGVWAALHGSETWPEAAGRREMSPETAGLEQWFGDLAVRRVARAMIDPDSRTVLVIADSEFDALNRAAALADRTGVDAVCLAPATLDSSIERLISLHAVLRRAVPIVCIPIPSTPEGRSVAGFEHHPGPVVLCSRRGVAPVRGRRPLLSLELDHLPVAERRGMWAELLPELASQSSALAARYLVEPLAAATAAGDARSTSSLDGNEVNTDALVSSFRARAEVAVTGGVKLRRPSAGWPQLVLPPDKLAQLKEAVDRLVHQSQVLDDWQFLAGRAGARGVRMLFAGPPGTGKTLSAEVLAGSLGVDLLVVDISRVVSKWLGETEKNLAEVFDAAERAHMVLFFDEADALFGKRTEVSDAHDRYANLETAYLLARLERCEGMVVLATNFRENVDPAFIRRLEFVIEFDEPGPREREALWRCHLPQAAPIDGEINLGQLANLYPVVGGVIRNAAVAAGFMAAADGGSIGMGHLVRAVRREYEKSGRPFPGTPFGVAAP
jgi:hypothetical protein